MDAQVVKGREMDVEVLTSTDPQRAGRYVWLGDYEAQQLAAELTLASERYLAIRSLVEGTGTRERWPILHVSSRVAALLLTAGVSLKDEALEDPPGAAMDVEAVSMGGQCAPPFEPPPFEAPPPVAQQPTPFPFIPQPDPADAPERRNEDGELACPECGSTAAWREQQRAASSQYAGTLHVHDTRAGVRFVDADDWGACETFDDAQGFAWECGSCSHVFVRAELDAWWLGERDAPPEPVSYEVAEARTFGPPPADELRALVDDLKAMRRAHLRSAQHHKPWTPGMAAYHRGVAAGLEKAVDRLERVCERMGVKL